MIPCAHCKGPLRCEACGEDYQPPTQEHYEALSRPEVSIDCQNCGALLVCHWCKTPYGTPADDDDYRS